MSKTLMITLMLVMAAAYSSAWSDTAGGRYIVCLDQRMDKHDDGQRYATGLRMSPMT